MAVIGVGGFGRHHARIYGELTAVGEAKLVGLVDTDPVKGKRARGEVGTCRSSPAWRICPSRSTP